ncbi:dipeptidase PepV [Pseudalkalibacillus caeni]
MVEWIEEVEKRKDDLIKDLQNLLRIRSVLDEEKPTDDAPFGIGIKEALDFMLKTGERNGFSIKNVDQIAGHLEMGQGEDLIGVLCHVDVVPEGDGWSSDPFGAEIRDGKIFARGAIDDKGPTIAALYAMQIIKELGLPLSKRIRMIVGTDEESNWRCVDRYFKKEEMPSAGFAPDAVFPIIHAEKGIADFELVSREHRNEEELETELLSFQSGQRLNMVPDRALAEIKGSNQMMEQISGRYKEFLDQNSFQGSSSLNEEKLTLSLEGISVHGSEPDKGINAGLQMAGFLKGVPFQQKGLTFIGFLNDFMLNDSKGNKLGVAFKDEISGELTMNVGTMSFSKGFSKIGVNLRYPVSCDFKVVQPKIQSAANKYQMDLHVIDHMVPHHVPKDHELIQTLQAVYREQTGEEPELLAIGGGTYARSLDAGVAFGALFPGKPEVAHEKDEYIEIEDLLKATAIYAQALYELAK